MPDANLNKITIKGFRSLRDIQLDLEPLNVLVGANGAGKSNLVAFFKMMNEMMGSRLQKFVAEGGRAQSILHFGPKVTPQIEAELEFSTETGTDTYYLRLFHAAGDTIVFAEEALKFVPFGEENGRHPLLLGTGHQETRIPDYADSGNPIAKTVRYLLNQCRVYHFHDTSASARIRQYCYLGSDRWLMPDGGNLAAILYRLRNKETGPAFRRILSLIRRIAPFFEDFDLQPTGVGDKEIILNWRQKDSDQLFGPHQLSDGTLRAMALVTLLQQPVEDLPILLVVDEPELGLHPAVKRMIAGLLKKASQHCQIVVATQSSAILHDFDAEDIIVVERDAKETTFQRQSAEALDEWLNEYTMGQLWEKNVLGGGPY